MSGMGISLRWCGRVEDAFGFFSGNGGRGSICAVMVSDTFTVSAWLIGHGELVVIVLLDGEIVGVDVNEVSFSEVSDAEFAEDIIDDGSSEFDGTVTSDGSGGFEAREDEGIDVFFEGDAVLESETDGDGEAVHQASEGSPFFMHIDEDFAQRAIGVFARPEVDVILADGGFLSVSASTRGEFSSVCVGCAHERSVWMIVWIVHELIEIEKFCGGEGLREFGAISVDGDSFESEFIGLVMDVFDVIEGGVGGEIDCFGDSARDEGLNGGHHGDVCHCRNEARAEFATAICAIEDGEVTLTEVRCAFDGHGTEGIEIGLSDLIFGEAQVTE